MSHNNYKICNKCGQRCVPNMPVCGRCFTPFPNHASVHSRPRLTIIAPLIVGIGIFVAILIGWAALGNADRPFIGTWYTDYGRRVQFNADGSFKDSINWAIGIEEPTVRTWKSAGNVIQVFRDHGYPTTYVWSLNLDGKSLNLTEGNSTEILFRELRRTPSSQGGGIGGSQ